MFGKRSPPSPMSERVRRIGERPTRSSPEGKALTSSATRAKRTSMFRQAALVLGEGERLTVAIKNLSATGARVEFYKGPDLPPLVELIEPTLNLRRWAAVVWQEPGVAGLKFVS